MTVTVSVENLSKVYRLGQIGSGTLAEDLNRWWARLRGRPDPYLRIGQQDQSHRRGEYIWALKDVSFEVREGEVLGIIGRNGAGKSTLLKVLSRVTAPTAGQVRLKGRVASLLEVGTGFHPELTGRENVFLNGAILGMSTDQVRRRFDEIVAFAEIERFIDTPVKRYSSGMYVRLAFAVAAHLEAEVLVMDEVLAVGDAVFQKKCLGQMETVAREGRTVLFVSHNMGSVQQLCQEAILLRQGDVAARGMARDVVSYYVESDAPSLSSVVFFDKAEDFDPWVESAAILANGHPSSVVGYGDSITVEVGIRSRDVLREPSVGLVISSAEGTRIVNTNNRYQASTPFARPSTTGRVQFQLGVLPLMEGRYVASLWLGKDWTDKHQFIERALSFEVAERDIWGKGRLPTRRISSLWWPTMIRFIGNEEDSSNCQS